MALLRGRSRHGEQTAVGGDGRPHTAPDAHAARAAYGELVRQYEGALLRAAWRLVRGNEDRAQDLVQEALVKGYEAYVQGRFEPGTNAWGWLLRIMSNAFINDYRRQRKWSADTDLDAVLADGAPTPDALRACEQDRPDAALLSATLDEELERALGELTPEARACVMLVDVEGMEYAEAAQALAIPVGTVRSRLSRARLQLHAQLCGYARERGGA